MTTIYDYDEPTIATSTAWSASPLGDPAPSLGAEPQELPPNPLAAPRKGGKVVVAAVALATIGLGAGVGVAIFGYTNQHPAPTAAVVSSSSNAGHTTAHPPVAALPNAVPAPVPTGAAPPGATVPGAPANPGAAPGAGSTDPTTGGGSDSQSGGLPADTGAGSPTGTGAPADTATGSGAPAADPAPADPGPTVTSDGTASDGTVMGGPPPISVGPSISISVPSFTPPQPTATSTPMVPLLPDCTKLPSMCKPLPGIGSKGQNNPNPHPITIPTTIPHFNVCKGTNLCKLLP